MNIDAKLKKFALIAAVACAPLCLNGCVALVAAGAAGGAGAVIGSDSRTVDVQMYDQQIEEDAKQILSDHRTDSDSKVFNVAVVAVNGNVLLAGQTTSWDYYKSCVEQIKKVQYVRKVYDYVENRAPISGSAMTKDAWITSKVKSALLFGEKISSGRFKVFTEDRVVYLMGYVTRDEAKRAIVQTKKVSDIKKIVQIFDYMDSAATPDPNLERSSKTTTSSSSLAAESQSTADNGGASIVGDDDDLLAPAEPANW